MRSYLSLLSIPLFIFTFLGSGLYLQCHNVADAFYAISPTVAIIPALIWTLFVAKGTTDKKIQHVISGMGDPTLLSMCIIFILAGAFGVVTQAIGCIDDLVNVILTVLPSHALLPGLFVLSASVSFSMGSSMGVVAAVSPLSIGLAEEVGLPLPLCLGIVVGGAMFGDNLSLISDTTLAATQTQKSTPHKKFKINAPIALSAALLYLLWIYWIQPDASFTTSSSVNFLKLLPYGCIIFLSLTGMNVFGVLSLGILIAGLIGIFDQSDYSLLTFTQDIYKGFSSMNEIMVLSLLVGGLIGLIKSQGGLEKILMFVEKTLSRGKHSHVYIELSIAVLIILITAAIANNVISVLLVGPIAQKLTQKYHGNVDRSATWLSLFSCSVQGVLPYGAQILLASRLGKVSPLEVSLHATYGLILGGIGLLFLLLTPHLAKKS